MADHARFANIMSNRSVEVMTTVLIRLHRGPATKYVELDLRDRTSAWGDQFDGYMLVDLLRVEDIAETVGQEIQSTSIDLADFQFEIDPGFLVSFRDCATRKVLDGSQVMVHRWISTPGWASEPYDLFDFDGYIDQALPTEFGVTMSCKAWTGRIAAASYPRHVVSPWCRYELGDSSCGVTPAAIDVVAETDSTRTRVVVSGVPQANTGGTLRMMSGINSGFTRSIERIEDIGGGKVALHLAPPGLPWSPSIGDQCRVRRGCDKTLSTCGSVFGNSIKFGGAPYVPAAESI